MLFEPRSDMAQWRTVYDHLATMSVGDVIKHDELATLLPDAAEGSVRGAFYRAVKQCEDELRRTFASVRGIGYRMVDAPEHARLAGDHHRRAKRQLKTAKRKAVSADRSRLSREERARIDAIELSLSRQIELTSRLEARVERLDRELKDARRDQRSDAAQLSERVDRLAELLERHGIGAETAAAA